MKSFDEFKKDIESVGIDRELTALRKVLLEISEEKAPSEQEQRWAWTRLDARLTTPTCQSGSFAWIRAMGWAVVAAVIVCFGVTFYNYSNPIGLAPSVTITDPDKMDAVYFYSPDAGADVIWVSGYDYLPSDYVIQ